MSLNLGNLSGIVGSLFAGVNVYDIAVHLYETQGEEAARRLLTPPQSFIEHVCHTTGADVQECLAEREKMVDEDLNFIRKLIERKNSGG